MGLRKKNTTVRGREYRLADRENRKQIDLKMYDETIKSCVRKVIDIPEEDILVEENCFVLVDFPITNADSRGIGKELSNYKSPMKALCVNRPVLFVGTKTNEGRIYSLANAEYREKINLQEYSDIIKDCIHSVCEDAVVYVLTDSYIISTPITTGQAREIGKRMGKHPSLKNFSLDRYLLFEGKNVEITIQ